MRATLLWGGVGYILGIGLYGLLLLTEPPEARQGAEPALKASIIRPTERPIRPPTRTEPTAPAQTPSIEAEVKRMTDFVAGLELPRIAWDEAVPHYAEPSGVEALLLAALIDDEALADLRCEVYPCVAVVTGREWGTDFLDRIQGTLDEVDPNATFYHVTFASPDQHAFTAAVIGGPELQAQQNYLLERVHDAMLDGDWHPGISPVHPSDPEAAEPLWLPDLPGAESSP